MKRRMAILIALLAGVALAAVAYAAYHQSISLAGNIYLSIPTPTPTPVPTPVPTPAPTPTPAQGCDECDGCDDWIAVARDALQRTTDDDAHMDELASLADDACSGADGTSAAQASIGDLLSLATTAEQRRWVTDANSQIGAKHTFAVSCHSTISQSAEGMDVDQTDQYVNGFHTAEYEYEKCRDTGDPSSHKDKLKQYALSAKVQADAHDLTVASSEELLAKAQKAAVDAWVIAADVRARIVAANATPTPTATSALTAPTAALTATPTEAPIPAASTPAPTAAPTLSPSPAAASAASVDLKATEGAAPTPAQQPSPAPEPTPTPTPASPG